MVFLTILYLSETLPRWAIYCRGSVLSMGTILEPLVLSGRLFLCWFAGNAVSGH